METQDITRDPAILVARASSAYQVISLLPMKMIKYELETQGLLAENSIGKCRKQLADYISSGKYKSSKQPVAMGAREDIALCRGYLNQWWDTVNTAVPNRKLTQDYSLRIRFLLNRIDHIAPAEDKMEELRDLDMLKKDAVILASQLKILELSYDHPKVDTLVKRNLMDQIFNWSLHDSPIHEPHATASPTEHFFKTQPPSRNKPKFFSSSSDHSLLDETLDFYQDDTKGQPRSRSSDTFNHTNLRTRLPQRSSTTNHTSPEAFMKMFQSPSHNKAKANIWKWDVKFHGTPNSMPAIEFIGRIRELAKSRGATAQDVFESATDLYEGDALKWLRAGIESGLLTTWEKIEELLLEDFESYTYGDDLFEYIKGRIQKPHERIVTYFAVMEDLFIKLGKKVLENLKVKIIKRNLREEFIRGLGFVEIQTVVDLKNHCKVLEADFLRINRRSSSSIEREPDSYPRHVTFNSKVYASDNNDSFYEENGRILEKRFEGTNNFHNRSRSPGISSQYRQRLNDQYRSRSPSPHPQREINSFDRRMNELSFREDPKLPIYSVPPPPVVRNRPNYENQTNYNNNDSRKEIANSRYVAPVRNFNTSNSPSPYTYNSYQSGNEQGSYQNRATDTPLLIKRPSSQY